MRVRTALIATAIATTALVASPARAGGPTSAILSIPGSGQTVSLYYTDAAYDELADLVGVGAGATGETTGAEHATGVGVTVTWLIHDVEPWRVDRIYLGGEDGVWISTQESYDGSIWESPVRWQRAQDGERLRELLGDLGLGSKAAADGSVDQVTGPADDEAAGSQPEVVRDEPAAASSGQGWQTSAGWAAGGLAGGVLLSVAWGRARRRTLDEASAPAPVAPPGGPAEVLVR